MDLTENTFQHLFEQLGLENDEESIQRFLEQHSVSEGIPLHKATFWTPAQAEFLREGFHDDADWVVAIDQLNTALRKN